jgi:hypothetical protein
VWWYTAVIPAAQEVETGVVQYKALTEKQTKSKKTECGSADKTLSSIPSTTKKGKEGRKEGRDGGRERKKKERKKE